MVETMTFWLIHSWNRYNLACNLVAPESNRPKQSLQLAILILFIYLTVLFTADRIRVFTDKIAQFTRNWYFGFPWISKTFLRLRLLACPGGSLLVNKIIGLVLEVGSFVLKRELQTKKYLSTERSQLWKDMLQKPPNCNMSPVITLGIVSVHFRTF